MARATKVARRWLEAGASALLACALLAGAGACRRPKAEGAASGGPDEAPAAPDGDASPCSAALQEGVDGFVERRGRERGADTDADLRARVRYNQCKRLENDEDLRHAPAKRQDEVREVRAALTTWVEARARLENAAQHGDGRGRPRAVAAALTDLERLVATTLLPGVWRLGGGAPAEGAAAARRKLEALAPAGSGGGSPAGPNASSTGAAGGSAASGSEGADYRSAYESMQGAQSRLERALAPLAPPEAAAAWHFVDALEL